MWQKNRLSLRCQDNERRHLYGEEGVHGPPALLAQQGEGQGGVGVGGHGALPLHPPPVPVQLPPHLGTPQLNSEPAPLQKWQMVNIKKLKKS